jgi:hypothetical protein
MLVVANGRGEVIEELLHRFGVGVGQDEGETAVCTGFDAGEDVGERETLVAVSALASLRSTLGVRSRRIGSADILSSQRINAGRESRTGR